VFPLITGLSPHHVRRTAGRDGGVELGPPLKGGRNELGLDGHVGVLLLELRDLPIIVVGLLAARFLPRPALPKWNGPETQRQLFRGRANRPHGRPRTARARETQRSAGPRPCGDQLSPRQPLEHQRFPLSRRRNDTGTLSPTAKRVTIRHTSSNPELPFWCLRSLHI